MAIGSQCLSRSLCSIIIVFPIQLACYRQWWNQVCAITLLRWFVGEATHTVRWRPRPSQAQWPLWEMIYLYVGDRAWLPVRHSLPTYKYTLSYLSRTIALYLLHCMQLHDSGPNCITSCWARSGVCIVTVVLLSTLSPSHSLVFKSKNKKQHPKCVHIVYSHLTALFEPFGRRHLVSRRLLPPFSDSWSSGY